MTNKQFDSNYRSSMATITNIQSNGTRLVLSLEHSNIYIDNVTEATKSHMSGSIFSLELDRLSIHPGPQSLPN